MFLLVFLIVLILALGGGGYAVPNLCVGTTSRGSLMPFSSRKQ
jgi:hypothetical protein